MSTLAWAVVVLLGAPIAYAALSVTFLLFVRFPDDTPFTVLEDGLLVLAVPFIAVLLGGRLLFQAERR